MGELRAHVEEGTVGELRAHVEEVTGSRPGDPVKIASAILAALAADNTPVRLALGNAARDRLDDAAEQTHKDRIAWESVSRGTDFGD
ncbi:Rossmann-fold NAD(P)-binding domain-containing protein [Streptomyces chiangmaiensis]|uniref:Short-chain dehydrogenase n=1 Tax=Streptomyces chiangmaiensis TaxID=766497 RepID=A0ABU7FPS1_9ACTN|nr:hypothetical protein [Streptomyces chiangmaiensis]MED7826115.1 hypothetical protein [Streptomyces chiangmaiensis]